MRVGGVNLADKKVLGRANAATLKIYRFTTMSADTSVLRFEYEAVSRIAERFTEEISKQLLELLGAQDIHMAAPIETRVKSWSSLTGKINSRSIEIDSVKDLNDFIGIRLILLFRRDLDAVEKLLKMNFEVIEHEDTAQRLKEDTFGYASVHYVIRLPDSWLALPTLRPMRGLKAEIQVRTMAQHIWASASHILQYKQEDNIPMELRRTIHRSSALLEIVDLEFERVLKEKEAYQKSSPAHKPSEPLNILTLEAALAFVLPAENKDSPEPYNDVLFELKQLEFLTGEDVIKLLQKHLSAIIKIDRDRVKDEIEHDFRHSKQPTQKERVKRGVYFSHVGLLRNALTLELGEGWRDKVHTKNR